MLASSATAIASMSPANASGWPWKLPVDMTSPSSAHDDRVVDDRAELDAPRPGGRRRARRGTRAVHLRRAAQRVGVLDGVVGVPVAGQQRAEPRAAGAGCRRWRAGRDAGGSHGPGSSYARSVPSSASTRHARRRRRRPWRQASASAIASASSACIGSVPLISERPSLARARAARGRPRPQLAARPAGRPVARRRSRPSPTSGSARCGELGQVAGRADRALAGDDRQQVAVEQLEQPRRQLGRQPE